MSEVGYIVVSEEWYVVFPFKRGAQKGTRSNLAAGTVAQKRESLELLMLKVTPMTTQKNGLRKRMGNLISLLKK